MIKKITTSGWRDAQKMLSKKERGEKMKLLAVVLEVAEPTVYYKFRSQKGLKQHEKKLIAAVYGKKVETMFPEN